MHIFFLATICKAPLDQCIFDDKDIPGPTAQHPQTSYFCQGGDEPKIQMPYQTIPGQIPRKLAIERYAVFLCTAFHRKGHFIQCGEAFPVTIIVL